MLRPVSSMTIYAVVLWTFFSTGLVFGAEEAVQVVIEGIENAERANVAAALVLPPGLVKEGEIDQQWLERFEKQVPDKVRRAMEPFGYYNPEVSLSADRPAKGIYRLQVTIKRGQPVLLVRVVIRAEGPGAGEQQLLEAIEKFPLRRRDVLRQDIYERAKEELKNKLTDLGYLDADFSTHKISISLGKSEAEIDVVLETGVRYRFGDVYFTGDALYPEGFLRRYLQFKKGDVFSYEKIAKTQANLVNTDRFRGVIVSPRKERAVDDQVPIEIALTPAPPKRFKIGAGYGTDTGPRGTLLYRDTNVAGKGHELSAEMRLSTTLQGIATGYVIPDNKDSNSFTSFKMAAQQEDTQSYVTHILSMEGEKTRSFGAGKIGSIFALLQKEYSEAGGQRTNSFVLVPGARFSVRWYDRLLRPNRGYGYGMELRGTHQALGSQREFVQFLTNGELRMPLPGRFSVLTRARLATTWQDGPAEDLPITFRFFAGGDNSIRGYKYQSLGPKDENGVVGGRHLLVGSIELERAIGSNWGIAAFYDAGNAFNNWASIEPAQGAGLGCRYYTPVGPLKLDLARQIGVQDPGYRVHLSIGLEL
jgi:translocation and assembly module TamA